MAGRTFISDMPTGIARLSRESSSGSWAVLERLQGEDVRSLAMGPSDTDLVLAGVAGTGVFRSTDRGTSWAPCGLSGETVTALAVAPSDPDRIYAGVRPPAVFRSDDRGETWTECEAFQGIRGRRIWRSPASPPFTAYVSAFAVSPCDPDLLVAGIEFGAVVRSTDGGETWSNHRRKAIRDCHSLVWHATSEDCVYEGGAGIPRRPGARSTDAGATWEKPGGGLDRGYGVAVAAHPIDPEVWYVSASTSPFAAASEADAKATVFRREGGTTWTRLESFPGERMPWALCTDPRQPDHLWAGRADGSIIRSTDRGDTWARIDATLPTVDSTMIMLPS